MRTKNILRATLLAATLVVAGYGGMKAYDYSYAKSVNSDDAMLMLNVEALTQDGEATGYSTILAQDCVQTIHGEPNSSVTIVLPGGISITLQTDSSGNASYTVKNGKRDCLGNGNLSCTQLSCN